MHNIIIFGATGDLTSRKLIPALYQLFRKKRLVAPFRITGFSRTKWESAAWRDQLAQTTKQFTLSDFQQELWNQFAQNIEYFAGDIANAESFHALERSLETQASREQCGQDARAPSDNRLYYFATAPQFYEQIANQLHAAGMSQENSDNSRRIVVEKPFGTNLETAISLNKALHSVFDEKQIFRIDHYLGKETVNNILVLRFANTIFEPIWNRNYIDHIQITANESVTIGRRAAFYETAGILRDMFQNHLLQILTFVTMEAPARFDAKAVRDEKLKLLQAIRPMSAEEIERNTLRGQYIGYRKEQGVSPESRIGTFGAIKLLIDNWRWKDVPIYLRSGKGMSCRTTQIMIQFKQPPHSMFRGHSPATHQANQLLIQIQPAEGLQIHFQTKVPDSEMSMRMTEFKFNFKDSFKGELPEAYERLLLDALIGDASLFSHSDDVEASWSIIDPIQKQWDETPLSPEEQYEIGSWGPETSTNWISQDARRNWFDLCPIV